VSETRTQIRECVQTNPGIHFNEISRTLDIATGQTQYHLRRLHRTGVLVSEDLCGRTHYYPPTYGEHERRVIALLRRETTREIVLKLLESGETAPGELADRLDLARSTVEWHLSNLIEYDVVHKRTASGRVVAELREPEVVYRLLREIEPRLSDRLADRFARLADLLLE